MKQTTYQRITSYLAYRGVALRTIQSWLVDEGYNPVVRKNSEEALLEIEAKVKVKFGREKR